MAKVDGGSTVWDEVAHRYGEGVSPVRLLSEELVRTARLRASERVVDIGSGNGWSLIPAARVVAPAVVVGVDFSAGMVEAARRRIADAGLRNVYLIRGDASRPGLADGAFDVVIASSVFQFLGYAPDALVAWGRLLESGGRLVFSVPLAGTTPAAGLLAELLVELSDRLSPELAARVRHLSPQPPDLSSLCLANGYRRATAHICDHRIALPGPEDWWQLHWSHGARGVLRAIDPRTLDVLRSRAFDRLRSMTDDGGRVPMDLRTLVCIAYVGWSSPDSEIARHI